MTEREAFMESILSEVEGEYFAARPQIDTADRRKVFQAGFQRAWQAACKYKAEQSVTSTVVQEFLTTADE